MLSPAYLTGKRLLDVAVSGAGLLALSPILGVVALAIKLTSPGPVIFRQVRIGRHQQPFYCLKFRSMADGAESRRHEVAHLNEMDGPVFKAKNDPRVTSVGRIIRKTSIDELPQLWNVLRGEMSLVGPRPQMPYEVEQYAEWMFRRLDARPGITCTWQISGRNNITFDEWMRMDVEYVESCSLLEDLKILARTVPAVLTTRGAS